MPVENILNPLALGAVKLSPKSERLNKKWLQAVESFLNFRAAAPFHARTLERLIETSVRCLSPQSAMLALVT